MPSCIIDILKARRAGTKDAHKIWVLADSGGNMGAVGGAMGTALADAGLMDCVDGVVGSSVGAYIMAYVLTGEGVAGTSIFPRYYCDNRFISAARLLPGCRPMMDLMFVRHDVLEQLIPLNYAGLKKLKKPFMALVWKRGSGGKLLALAGVKKIEIQQALTHTARMPVIGTGWNTARFDTLDGWLAECDLPRLLQAKGVTHVLHIHNRPLRDEAGSASLAWWMIARWVLWRDPLLGQAIARRESRKLPWQDYRIAAEDIQLPTHDVVALTKSRSRLLAVMRQAYVYARELADGNGDYALPVLWCQLEVEL